MLVSGQYCYKDFENNVSLHDILLSEVCVIHHFEFETFCLKVPIRKIKRVNDNFEFVKIR